MDTSPIVVQRGGMTDDEWDAFLENGAATRTPPKGVDHVNAKRDEPTVVAVPTARGEDEDVKKTLTSSVVPLPNTVPELVRSYETLYLRCEEMRAVLDSLRVQANHLATSSPSAGVALADLLNIVSDGDVSPATAPAGSGTQTPQRPASSAGRTPVQEQSPVGAPTALGTVSHTRLSGSPAVAPGRSSPASSGDVVTGRVVAVPGKIDSIATGAPIVEDPSTRSRLSRFVEDFRRDYKEEYNVLRTQMLGMAAAQQLLSVARAQLQDAEKVRKEQEKELRRLQDELDSALANNTQLRQVASGRETSEMQQPQPEVQLAEAVESVAALKKSLSSLAASRDAALYSEAQLEKKTKDAEESIRFLTEKNEQLEGQLQRLLTAQSQALSRQLSPVERCLGQQNRAPATATGREVKHSPTSSPQRPCPPTQGGGITAEAYNRAACEKQIEELRAMVDKLQRRVEVNVERRKKAESAVSSLTKENAALKADVLHYRRQVNENELDLELEASTMADEKRTSNLEKEVLRLRNALRERKDAHDAAKAELASVVAVARRRNRVFELSSMHLQRKLLRCQLKLVILTQCGAAVAAKLNEESAKARRLQQHGPTPKVDPPPAGTHESSSRHTRLGGAGASSRHSTDVRSAENAVEAPASFEGSAASPKGDCPPNVSFGSPQLQHNRDALEEMRQLYERRMETLEAQRRAEVKQVQHLNKELRNALAASQEEVEEKNRLLELARLHRQGVSGHSGSGLTRQDGTPMSLPIPLVSNNANNTAGATPEKSPRSPPVGVSSKLHSVESSRCGHPAAATAHLRLFSVDSSSSAPLACTTATGTAARTLSDIEQRYDPENMSVWEAVQVENEALLRRVSALQEEKWCADSIIEDMRQQTAVLERELERNASTMTQLMQAGVFSPAAVQKGQEEGRLRSLQCLLQDTLSQKLKLEEKVTELTDKVKRLS